jgi:hypothetical protein
MDVKNIILRINHLSHKEKHHILNILKANNIEYTKNTNGFFFNFLKIKDDTVDKIIKCLELIEKNCNLIKEMDKRRNDLIKHYKIIIEEKLKTSFEKRRNEYINYLSLKHHETNINYDIKRVIHIRRNKNFLTKNSNQAELMLKEYQKLQTKFKKNSVYHRIYSTIKSNKRYTEPKVDNESNDVNDDYKIIDENNDEIEIEENIDEIENIEEIEHYISDDENKSEKSYISENSNDNSDDSDHETTITTITNKNTIKQKIETDIKFYKNLLYQQGFSFDDNKKCFLVRETYIL